MVRLPALAIGIVISLLGTPARAECANILPASVTTGEPRRDVTARDLIELRYIGEPSVAHVIGPSPLALSPDRRSVAFILSKPDVAGDRDCQALVLLDVATRRVRVIDTGGERAMQMFSIRGVRVTDGWPPIVTPQWSPDGSRVGYLKRIAGVNQLWVARADGSGARALTTRTTDVETWAWAADGRSAIFATRAGETAAIGAIALEARSGYLYDERIWPDWASSPRMSANVPLETYVSDGTNMPRAATVAERSLLQTFDVSGHALDDTVVSAAGHRAYTRLPSGRELGPRALVVMVPGGGTIRCDFSACRDGIIDKWWDGETLVFLHREGWDNERTALYRWPVGRNVPHQVMATYDALLGCVFVGRDLICTSESSASPRRIVRVDTHDGRTRSLFDTAPEFVAIRLGKVERLRVTNAFGLRSWADLVLPPTYQPGVRLPTIVIQYHSRGFLRGGVGDEYPVFLFAARGYAVLSIERPNVVGSNNPTFTTYDQINAFMAKDWAERRSLLSSVFASLDAATALGVIDPARVGITGLSDGAATVQFAMVNSSRFAAAAISSGLLEPTSVMINGVGWSAFNRRLGYPSLIDPNPSFWKPMSLVINARSVTTPLLIQAADREYTEALEGFTALREAAKPVDLYIFPDEYHNKRSPVHRLAIYDRNIDWFDFWLRNREDPEVAKSAQYLRWRQFRSRAALGRPGSSPDLRIDKLHDASKLGTAGGRLVVELRRHRRDVEQAVMRQYPLRKQLPDHRSVMLE